jgi:hypothetical protein
MPKVFLFHNLGAGLMVPTTGVVTQPTTLQGGRLRGRRQRSASSSSSSSENRQRNLGTGNLGTTGYNTGYGTTSYTQGYGQSQLGTGQQLDTFNQPPTSYNTTAQKPGFV